MPDVVFEYILLSEEVHDPLRLRIPGFAQSQSQIIEKLLLAWMHPQNPRLPKPIQPTRQILDNIHDHLITRLHFNLLQR